MDQHDKEVNYISNSLAQINPHKEANLYLAYQLGFLQSFVASIIAEDHWARQQFDKTVNSKKK
jgi:hypothetical protein